MSNYLSLKLNKWINNNLLLGYFYYVSVFFLLASRPTGQGGDKNRKTQDSKKPT